MFEGVGAPTGAAAVSKPVWGLGQIIDNFERWGVSWQPGSTVSYAFLQAVPAARAGDPEHAGFRPLTDTERQFARTAFDLVADVARLSFTEVADNGSISGRIALGASTTLDENAWGWASVRSSGSRITGSDIWYNADAVATRSWVVGGYNFQAAMHEIIHALGVPHPGDYNADGTPITYAQHAEYFQDSRQYTVMSYFAAAETGANHRVGGVLYSGATPLLHDVAALQAIYGANTATRAGDTVYGYNATAGRDAFDFTVNRAPIVCIWDGGGIDLLDLSGSSTAVNLDLNEGAFSDACGMTDNIAIAYGARIENGRGSGFGDSLLGNVWHNQLWGGVGDDVLEGGAFDDQLDGGAGSDTASYAGSATGVTASLAISGWQLTGPTGWEILTSIENLTGSAYADALTGDGGANLLKGGAGDDVLEGGLHDDRLDGGAGIDTASWAGAATAVTADLRIAGWQLTGPTGWDLLSSIENLTGSAFNDRLTGDGGANLLKGGAGDDVLEGGLHDDRLDGGAGADTASYAGAATAVTVDLRIAGWQLTGATGWEVLTSIENLTGSGFDDRLTGDARANVLVGGAGDDLLDGGAHDDRLDGGAGSDTASYAGSASGVSVDLALAGAWQLTGPSWEALVSIENLVGSAHADALRGDGGRNRLDGGAGNDALFGGAGDDAFLFRPGFGQDRISDFVAGGVEDQLDFSAFAGAGVTSTLSQVGADAVFTFSNGDVLTLAGVDAQALVKDGDWLWS